MQEPDRYCLGVPGGGVDEKRGGQIPMTVHSSVFPGEHPSEGSHSTFLLTYQVGVHGLEKYCHTCCRATLHSEGHEDHIHSHNVW